MRTSLLKFTFSASSAYRPQFQWQCQRILLMLSAYTVFVNFALHTKQKLSCGAKLLHMKTFATQAIMSRDKYGIWWSGYILRLRLMWQSRGSKNTFLNKCAFSDYSCSIKQKFGRGLSDLFFIFTPCCSSSIQFEFWTGSSRARAQLEKKSLWCNTSRDPNTKITRPAEASKNSQRCLWKNVLVS